ncbi:MAG: hypothetical protein IJC63_00940 [Myxococcaceae bacterium]|nr:hypothetical protein [Myxococcaceae bacterium]MBR2978517.1 hypothetical protein [Myxococcaceae bacterium]
MKTTKDNVVIPELFAEAITQALEGLNCLNGTRAAVIDKSLTSKVVGETISVPYFGALGEFQELGDGDPITPSQLTSSKETNTVKRYGLAFDMTRWARLAGTGKPYEVASQMLVDHMRRKIDAVLIDAAKESLPAAMKLDISSETDEAAKLSYDALVQARQKFGDEQNDGLTLFMHSKAFGDLCLVKDETGRPIFADAQNGGFNKAFGMDIVVSDRLAVDSSGNYTSLICKPAALVAWINGDITPFVEHSGLTDSDTVSVNLYMVAHRYKALPGKSKGGVVAIVHK